MKNRHCIFAFLVCSIGCSILTAVSEEERIEDLTECVEDSDCPDRDCPNMAGVVCEEATCSGTGYCAYTIFPDKCDGEDNDFNGEIDTDGENNKCRLGESKSSPPERVDYDGDTVDDDLVCPFGMLSKRFCIKQDGFCKWGEWSECYDECEPGSTEDCNECGYRECMDYIWSECRRKSENDCWNDDGLQSNDCGAGDCGIQYRTCVDCLWGDWDECSLKSGSECYTGQEVECETTCGSIGKGICTTDCQPPEASHCDPPPEVCNEIDEDCDTLVDEGVANTYYRDSDDDGYGDPDNATTSCSRPEGFSENNRDCNDSDFFIHPGITEVCDGIDNNCDSLTDEDLDVSCPPEEECCAGVCRKECCSDDGCYCDYPGYVCMTGLWCMPAGADECVDTHEYPWNQYCPSCACECTDTIPPFCHCDGCERAHSDVRTVCP